MRQEAPPKAISLDYNYAMADFVGEQGLGDRDLEELIPRLKVVHQELAAAREKGDLAFLDLPYRTEVVKEIKSLAKPYLEWCLDFIVLGIGGSALGARALRQALAHPHYNHLPLGRRAHRPRLWVADNIDPDYIFGLMDVVELRRAVFNVISKSGSTAETLAQFLIACKLIRMRVGEEHIRDRIILTTDPEKGPLRRLVEQESFPSLSVPPRVGGRFSVLSAVGLLPAVMAGIDVEELLAGARFMDQTLKDAPLERHPAYRLAALYYLFAAKKHRPNLVMMPYAAALGGMADWFCQLWAESLGKKFNLAGQVVEAGSTPIKAVGVTDQHSQLQLYMEGPQDKLITFLEVEKFQHPVEMPSLFGDLEQLSYLADRSLNDLLSKELEATRFNLMKAGRPSLSLTLPEITPHTVGQLIYLLEVATVAAGHLYGVNPLDQPGVEGGKQTTYGLMGRVGFEDRRREFDQAPPRLEKYRIS
jgi:glucose-6-phosphate isomerase